LSAGVFHASIEHPNAQAEERVVCDIASRRLIPLPNLAAVIEAAPGGDHSVWAALLGVARDDVRDRLANLTADERRELQRLGG
jgi:hypothetical protein